MGWDTGEKGFSWNLPPGLPIKAITPPTRISLVMVAADPPNPRECTPVANDYTSWVSEGGCGCGMTMLNVMWSSYCLLFECCLLMPG